MPYIFQEQKKSMELIGNLKHLKEIKNPTYGHMEFVMAKDLYKTVYADVVDFLDSISGLGNRNSISLNKKKRFS